MFFRADRKYSSVFVSITFIIVSNISQFNTIAKSISHNDTVKTRQWFDNLNPIDVLSTPQLIEKFGYPVEIHETTTKDGYILTMHRIPRGRNSSAPRRQPVLAHHGNLCDSSVWLLNDPDKNLVLQLADLGYDVWLVNIRGTLYSRKHKTLSPRDNNFYKFTMSDHGKYDMPAQVDHILEVTGAPKLILIGHSMAGPVFFTFTSVHPQYNDKISLMVGLGAAAYAPYAVPVAKIIATLSPVLKIIFNLASAGVGEFPPLWITKIIRMYGQEGCSNTGTASMFCENFLFLVVGFSPSQRQLKEYPALLSHLPSQSSTIVFDHLMQSSRSNRFQNYDYGSKAKNMKIYGTPKPEQFFIKRTTVPVAHFYGNNDMLVDKRNVRITAAALPNTVLLHQIADPMWNHMDFYIGKDVNELLNRHIIEIFSKY